MQSPTKALIIGIVAGLVLLSLVVSMNFVYVAPRTAVAYVVNDNMANIALIPNNNHLQSQNGYFAFINKQGDLEINFGNIAPYSAEQLSDVFYVQNNLNQPVNVTISVDPANDTTLGVYLSDPPMPSPPPPPPAPPAPMPPVTTSITFTLQPGQSVPISLILIVGQVAPGTHITFTITVTAEYNVGTGQ
ncbi:hypothetical protein [Sulfurisphaera ohwakuensis]|uniref:hypothetical protein n=1 Tax=Sulfurisphaera ohwakuensis TaxID=69656 RepID=UPI0036F2364D